MKVERKPGSDLLVLDAGEPLESRALKGQGCHIAREEGREGSLKPENFYLLYIKRSSHAFTAVQACARSAQAQLWPRCCCCGSSSSSSCASSGGGDGSSSSEDARSSPVDAAKRKTTGIWARAGLVSCRPWIHLASVAWSWAPAMHMAKTGPSSTVGGETGLQSLCSGNWSNPPPPTSTSCSHPFQAKGRSFKLPFSFLVCPSLCTRYAFLPRLPIPWFNLCDAPGSSRYHQKVLPTAYLKLGGMPLPLDGKSIS